MSDVVMVGVDGSENSAAALQWAASEAERRQSRLEVVYCLHLPTVAQYPFGAAPLDEPTFTAYAEAILDSAKSVAHQFAPDLEVRTRLLTRPATAGLLEASADAALIVLGTRGLGALNSVFLGSVSTRVAARAACPTVVVPHNGDQDEKWGTGPIVVGIDGSAHSDAALRYALGHATRGGNPVTLVYGHQGAERADQNDTHDPQRVLTEAFDRARTGEAADLAVDHLVLDAEPADAVVAASHGASLTVVGSRGRGGFSGMLLGSVSQTVLRRVENPVTVVHAPHGSS